MELWRFASAERKFLKTREILIKPANLGRQECIIDRLHVEHGLAMIHRFQGEDSEAIRRYGDLIHEINREIQEIERNNEDVPNLADSRPALRSARQQPRAPGRLLPLRPAPDYAAAAYYYRRAVQLTDRIPESDRAQVACDLRFREAIALCLQRREFAEQPADGAAFATADRDEVLRFLAEKARRLFEGALRDYGRIGVVDPPIASELSRMIALTCLNDYAAGPARFAEPTADLAADDGTLDAGPPDPAPAGDLRGLVEQLAGSGRQFNRDELERLMFAVRLLIRLEGGRDDPFETLELVDQLHRLCRSSLQVAGADRGVLAYLRPYYDAVFAAKLEYQPIGEKELIEVIWEATTGDLNPPPVSEEPVLAMYLSGGRCHLILDVPHGRSGALPNRPGRDRQCRRFPDSARPSPRPNLP